MSSSASASLASTLEVHHPSGCFALQVSIATQTPGVVLITVTGFNVPKGPQNYSLAVQGDFNGVLASPRNPSWNRTSATSCSLPLPQITSGPLGLINTTSVTFTFTSSTGMALASLSIEQNGPSLHQRPQISPCKVRLGSPSP